MVSLDADVFDRVFATSGGFRSAGQNIYCVMSYIMILSPFLRFSIVHEYLRARRSRCMGCKKEACSGYARHSLGPRNGFVCAAPMTPL